MTAPGPAPRLAVAQVPMHWALADNLRQMQQALHTARDDGAVLCTFAELAVTGFHRRILEWAQPKVSGAAVDALCETAARLGIAVAFGAPTYGPGPGSEGQRYNSHLFVDAQGRVVGEVAKIGLTAPEATVFSPGTGRPVVALAGLRCSAVICREIEDADTLVPALQGTGVQLLLWPGQMRPDPTQPLQEPPVHVQQAQALARATGAYVLQANWPNALNRPEESAHTGHSACIAPDGELLFRLPEQGFGVAVFALGERRFRWHPCGAQA